MKIYFAGSIRGGRDDAERYSQIIDHLKKHGEVLTEHVGDKKLMSSGEDSLDEKHIPDRDLDWILESNVMVVEVTQPSLGVGYEIGTAIAHHVEVLCLYRPQEGKKLSAMIKGCKDVTNAEYHNIEEAKKIIDEFFE